MKDIKTYDTVVIGGGLSGIAAALRRRSHGDSVLLLEKNNRLGGKLDVKEWNGYRWDKGPSLFTLPHLVDELFELFGKQSSNYFKYKLHHENTRYVFNDGTRFTFYSEPEKRKKALAPFFSKEEIENVESYIRKISKTYNSLGDLFIARPKISLKSATNKELVKQYPQMLSRQMLNSLNRYNERKLRNPKLVQLFNRFGTYNGSNPYKMSGLYSMIPHLELNVGTFFPAGGMRAIIDSLERLSKEEEIDILLNEERITAKLDGPGYIVQTTQGEIRANNLICSIDHVNFYKNVLRDEALYKKHAEEERSSSAIVFYWAIKHHFEEIGLHNIFFSEDYAKEFKELFDLKKTPVEPTIYIHNSSAIEKNDAPEGCQNWFVMVHSPAGVEPTTDQMGAVKNLVIEKLKRLISIDITDHIIHEDHWTMASVEAITGSFKGALYGGAFNTKAASFKRHGNQNKKYKNLYFTGGSVHPGGGIPLVLKSAKIVDQLIEQHAKSS